MFNLDPKSVKMQNYRLRLYNAVSDTKLDTYGGREKQTLEQLKIGSHKHMLLEVKKDSEIFEQFLTGFITLRIVLWDETNQ